MTTMWKGLKWREDSVHLLVSRWGMEGKICKTGEIIHDLNGRSLEGVNGRNLYSIWGISLASKIFKQRAT